MGEGRFFVHCGKEGRAIEILEKGKKDGDL